MYMHYQLSYTVDKAAWMDAQQICQRAGVLNAAHKWPCNIEKPSFALVDRHIDSHASNAARPLHGNLWLVFAHSF